MDAQHITAKTPTTDAPASDSPSALSSLIDAAKRFASGFRQSLEQGAEAMLALGKGLLVLKDALPHGEFLAVVVEKLGLKPKSAQNAMAAALCFREGTPRYALIALGKGKLYELAQCDEDELDALTSGGTLHGCALAEIQAMSIKHLRAWLREQAVKEAPDVAEKHARIDALAENAKCCVDESFAPLQPGDRIRSLHAKRPGFVVRTYGDGSAAVHWDGREQQPFGFAHERMPRHLLELVKRPDPAAAKARRKDYCRELCRMLARYADDAETLELARALEDVSARILARRYCPGLNAAAYDVFARYGMKDALTRFAVEGGVQ